MPVLKFLVAWNASAERLTTSRGQYRTECISVDVLYVSDPKDRDMRSGVGTIKKEMNLMPPAIDWKKHEHLFVPGVRAGQIAGQIGCCTRVVYARAKMMGFDFQNGTLVSEEKYQNRTVNYLATITGGIRPRPLEGLSGYIGGER